MFVIKNNNLTMGKFNPFKLILITGNIDVNFIIICVFGFFCVVYVGMFVHN